MFKTILVAADGSDHAHRAINAACALAKACEATLHLVHVPQLEMIAVAVGASAVVVPYSEEDVTAAAQKVVDAATAQVVKNGCSVASVHISQGDPAHVIQEQAEAIGADLIVTGRRGLGKLTGLLLGSVSQKISQIAPCAHMTVP